MSSRAKANYVCSEADVERALGCIEHDPNGGCWLWSGNTQPQGYGKFWARNPLRYLMAHRVIFAHFRGDPGSDLVLDHLCRVPSCVNPAHLEAVTQKVNTLRSPHKGRKTHCKMGHEFSPENTKIVQRRGSTARQCITCRNAVLANEYARLKQNRRARGLKIALADRWARLDTTAV